MRVRSYFRKYIPLFKNKVFVKVYLAETISLLGDAFMWVGLALLAYQLDKENSSTILSVALAIRVFTYFLIAPVAGVLADRVNRKGIMIICHLLRMVVVAGFPFIDAVWQIYLLVFLLNSLNAVFTPAYKAVLTSSVEKNEFPNANALSSSTYQLLGTLGPGIAGGMVGLIGARDIFFINAATFLIAGVLLLWLPYEIARRSPSDNEYRTNFSDLKKGTKLIFTNRSIRFAMFMNLIAAIAGAQVLINTVGYIKGTLKLGDAQYGWAMTALGIGATLSAFTTGILSAKIKNEKLILFGAIIVSVAIIPAPFSSFVLLLVLWFIAGLGQNQVETPTQNIIARSISKEDQGKAYGAHFAWTHLGWAIGYGIAGLFDNWFKEKSFLYGGLLSVALFLLFSFLFYRGKINSRLFQIQQQNLD